MLLVEIRLWLATELLVLVVRLTPSSHPQGLSLLRHIKQWAGERQAC